MSTPARPSGAAARVLIIAVCWTLALLLLYVNTWLTIGDLEQLGKLEGAYEFLPDFAATTILAFIGGLAGGYLLVFRINSGHRQRSFTSGIIRSGVLFIAVYLGAGATVLFALGFASSVLHTDPVAALHAGWINIVVNIVTPSFAVTTLVWGLLASGTQFMLQVNDKFGPGILWKMITGRYYHPREEERIFMFLDLQSSTTIAERLGHRLYFELLRELYQDITAPITGCGGEIYQYVGDEVVISWSPGRGVRDRNCVRCFFRIEETIDHRRSEYVERFGLSPVFKAGVHIGPATVGEIGVVKKDIVFSGDVLNTAARIQAECNRHNVRLLVSADLLQLLPLQDEFEATPIGHIPLRGKAEPLALSVVSQAQPA